MPEDAKTNDDSSEVVAESTDAVEQVAKAAPTESDAEFEVKAEKAIAIFVSGAKFAIVAAGVNAFRALTEAFAGHRYESVHSAGWAAACLGFAAVCGFFTLGVVAEREKEREQR